MTDVAGLLSVDRQGAAVVLRGVPEDVAMIRGDAAGERLRRLGAVWCKRLARPPSCAAARAVEVVEARAREPGQAAPDLEDGAIAARRDERHVEAAVAVCLGHLCE